MEMELSAKLNYILMWLNKRENKIMINKKRYEFKLNFIHPQKHNKPHKIIENLNPEALSKPDRVSYPPFLRNMFSGKQTLIS